MLCYNRWQKEEMMVHLAKMRWAAICCLLPLLLLVSDAGAGKVLVLSMQFGSHLNEFAAVTGTLVKMGHTVHVVMDENRPNPSQFKGQDVEFLYYKSPDKEIMDQKKFDDKLAYAFLEARTDDLETTRNLDIPRFTYDCKRALFDQDLIKRLEEEKYDIALADFMIPCYHLLVYKLNLKAVTVSTTQMSWHMKTHPFVPFFRTCGIRKETNSFLNRLQTLYDVYMFERVIMPTTFIEIEHFMDYIPGKPYSSLEEVIMKTTVLFIYNKNGILDCATPSMQNVIIAGGLTTVPPKPLQPDYQQYVRESPQGIIIVSFGSGVASFPKKMFMKFLNAFRRVKQNVIWRTTKTYGEEIPLHVKIVNWMPQNDLMADPHVKLFITHSGNNGQFEALYHGVPMIGFPIFADQFYNTKRITLKGFGLGMDIFDFTSEELVKNINEIIDNPKYSEAIKRASEIHRSLPDPRNTSAFWIDHVMKYGGDHLQTALNEMTFIEYFMIDLYLFFFSLLLIIIFVVKKVVSILLQQLNGNAKPKKKTN